MTAKARRRRVKELIAPRPVNPTVAAWYAMPRPVRPAVIEAPWGSRYVSASNGVYHDPATGYPISHGALQDRIARHREQGRPTWRVTPGGHRWLPAGARVGVVWPAFGGWKGGHLAPAEPGGVWLIEGASIDLALRMVEQWAERQPPAGDIDEMAVATRLDRPKGESA